VIFMEHSSTTKVFRAPLRHYNKAVKTVVSLWVSDCDLLSPDVRVSLASSSSCNHLILALVAVKST
jgi:hypothetical protein